MVLEPVPKEEVLEQARRELEDALHRVNADRLRRAKFIRRMTRRFPRSHWFRSCVDLYLSCYSRWYCYADARTVVRLLRTAKRELEVGDFLEVAEVVDLLADEAQASTLLIGESPMPYTLSYHAERLIKLSIRLRHLAQNRRPMLAS